jgi:hypothetical protein
MRWYLDRGTWGRLTLGALLIGGVLALLWAIYQPTLGSTGDPEPTPPPPRLNDTRAGLVLQREGEEEPHRAVISCDGSRRSASGFWGAHPQAACDALASTREALLSGPGCESPSGTTLRVSGTLSGRPFEHTAQRGGCPDPDAWLAVNVLASPVLEPDRELDDPAAG